MKTLHTRVTPLVQSKPPISFRRHEPRRRPSKISPRDCLSPQQRATPPPSNRAKYSCYVCCRGNWRWGHVCWNRFLFGVLASPSIRFFLWKFRVLDFTAKFRARLEFFCCLWFGCQHKKKGKLFSVLAKILNSDFSFDLVVKMWQSKSFNSLFMQFLKIKFCEPRFFCL